MRHHWPASETPFKWRFDGGLIIARFFVFDTLSYHQKMLSKLDSLWQNFLDPRSQAVSGDTIDIFRPPLSLIRYEFKRDSDIEGK